MAADGFDVALFSVLALGLRRGGGHMVRKQLTLCVAMCVALGVLGLAPAQAAQVPCGNTGALVQAVSNALNNDVVALTGGCTYTFTGSVEDNSAFPVIRKTITIEGNGATLVRSAAEQFRFFSIDAGANLTVRDVTIDGGHAPDGPNGSDAGPGAAQTGGFGKDGGTFHN